MPGKKLSIRSQVKEFYMKVSVADLINATVPTLLIVDAVYTRYGAGAAGVNGVTHLADIWPMQH
jgi:hypothetical protein